MINSKASSVGEIFFELLYNNNYKLNPDLAKLLYISISSDTRNFTQSNATSKTHFAISELLKTNINPEIINNYFESHSINTIKVFGKVLNRITISFDNKLAWSYITKAELDKCPDHDVSGLIETIRNIKNIKAAVLFKEVNNNITKINLRGKNGFNVYKIAKKFNGGGHLQASGFNYNDNLKNSIDFILKQIKIYF